MFRRLWIPVVVMAAMAGATQAEAQVTREDDVSSLAGLLQAGEGYQDFTFWSRGGEILFADVDADLYQFAGRRTEDHEDDGGGGGGGTGCEDEGGPGGLCLQVLDRDGHLLCWADRPARPGWQRDPRLSCPIPESRGWRGYVLRVALRGEEGACGQTDVYPSVPEGGFQPYLLNVSLRRIASPGDLDRALDRSTNRFAGWPWSW